LSVNTPLSSSFESLKIEVSKFAQVFDWNSAAQLIEDFLKTSEDNDKRTLELLGDCYYNLAFQQNTRDEFKQVIIRAKEAYERLADDNRSKARGAFCKYWSSDNPDERREIIISECLPPTRQLVEQLDATPESDETIVAKGYVELIDYLTVACSISSDRKQLVELVKEAKLTGRSAFNRFKSSSNQAIVISVTNSYAFFFSWAVGIFVNSQEAKQIRDELLPLVDTFLRYAETSNDSRTKSVAYETAGIMTVEFKGNLILGSSLLEKAVLEAKKTSDLSIIARNFFLLGYSLYFGSQTTDVTEQKKEYGEKSLNYSLKAIETSKVQFQAYELSQASYYFIQQSFLLSKDIAINEDKLRYLDRAIEFGRTALKYSEFCPTTQFFPLGNVLGYKAELVSVNDERERLLAEGVTQIENSLPLVEALIEPDSWNIGVACNALGLAKARLSEERGDNVQEKESLLREAASDLSRAADICSKALLSVTTGAGTRPRVAKMYEDLGNTLVKLYDLSRQKENSLEAIKAYNQASDYYSQANLIGFVAPITWKVSRLYDSLAEYEKSSSEFARAAQQYQAASMTQKSLQRSFLDLSLYMQAWSKIENARLLHSDEKYESASEKLKQASDILDKTESFKYLTKHYEAFSMMEGAEELSTKESDIESSSAFARAYETFEQAKNEMLNLAKERSSEESELKEWSSLSEFRAKYCLARKELDEAKMLDKNGEVKQSMTKYRSATETFRQLELGANEVDRLELDALSLSCEAWATMKEAELKSSPELYSKASEIFAKAKENNIKQSFVLSCLANSSICEAFEAGTRFKKSRDVSLYSEIKKKLGAASQFYEEAGFEIASDWTGATEALFDALAYLAAAEGEMDSTKKTQMYHLAEKHLELSARRYGDIGYDKKRQEVLKQLKKARENRELLITPMEALSQSPTVSTTPVNFTRDQAVGLERFEVANLTGNMSVSANTTDVGSSIRIDIDIANVGKTPALLMKLDNLAPLHGFEIDTKNNSDNEFQNFHVVDGNTISLDLRGKRLEYLKSHEVSLHLIAKNRGNFQLKPRILFLDELGKYRLYEFEPQNVQVTSIERKLAAIMFTDMAGYTALGQRNESLSIALVNEQRKLLRPIFKRHNGREVKTMGDAFLVEFASALDAARCAYDIQRAAREFNISLPEDKRIVLRVGVHIGDIVESDDGDITGDAVNVASRIEPLAEHGGVCVTRQVYENIQNKFDLKHKSLGLKSLKNVSSQIEVFKMIMPWD
jgi:class 3 adenylate cyclase